MTKIGIIRCDSYSDNCPASSCLKAVRGETGEFERHSEPVLVGLDTCGGCQRGSVDKILKKGKRLQERGAEVVHFGNCLVGPCPYLDVFTEAFEKAGIEAVHGTH